MHRKCWDTCPMKTSTYCPHVSDRFFFVVFFFGDIQLLEGNVNANILKQRTNPVFERCMTVFQHNNNPQNTNIITNTFLKKRTKNKFYSYKVNGDGLAKHVSRPKLYCACRGDGGLQHPPSLWWCRGGVEQDFIATYQSLVNFEALLENNGC